MIDTFTRTEFEEALPRHKTTGEPLCTHQGVQEGEHTYRMVTATPGDDDEESDEAGELTMPSCQRQGAGCGSRSAARRG